MLRILAILATTTALHVGYTPPNPSPPDNERPTKISSKLSDQYLSLAQSQLPVLKSVFWLAALCEIATIVSQELPAFSSLSPLIPTAFLIRDDSNGIYLSLQSMIGMSFIIAAGLIRLQCYRILGRFFTFEVSIRKGHQLMTSGPYGIVRHPAYTGILFLYIGIILYYSSPGAWLRESAILDTLLGRMIAFGVVIMLSGVVASLRRRIPLEDEVLKNLFKTEWENWARRVPYCLIPWVY